MVKLPIRIPMYLEDIVVMMANKTMAKRRKSALALKKKDETVVLSIAMQINKGQGLTAKQQSLCIKLVREYEGQLRNKCGLEIEDYNSIPLRLGTRKPIEGRPTEYEMDLNEKENVIEVRFPFDETIQKFFRSQQFETRGRVQYHPITKHWTVYASSFNIKSYVKHFVDKFKISKRLEERFDSIMKEDEKHERVMELQSDLSIPYAPEELVDFLKTRTEEMTEKEQRLYIIDRAGLYGYTISAKVLDEVYAEYGFPLSDLIVRSGSTVDDNKLTPEIVMEYSRLVNRDILLVATSKVNRWAKTWDKAGYPWTKIDTITKSNNIRKLDLSKAHCLVLPFSGTSFYKFYVRECAAGRSDRVICVTDTNGYEGYDFSRPAEKSFIVRDENTFNY